MSTIHRRHCHAPCTHVQEVSLRDLREGEGGQPGVAARISRDTCIPIHSNHRLLHGTMQQAAQQVRPFHVGGEYEKEGCGNTDRRAVTKRHQDRASCDCCPWALPQQPWGGSWELTGVLAMTSGFEIASMTLTSCKTGVLVGGGSLVLCTAPRLHDTPRTLCNTTKCHTVKAVDE